MVVLFHDPAAALQPTFINGTVYNSYSNALVTNATIITSTGVGATTSSGTFNLRVPPSIYTLIVSAPGYQSNILTGIWAAPGKVATVDLYLIPASTPTCTIEGRVMQGLIRSPVSGALVCTDLGGVAITDSEGYFKMTSPSGTARISIAASGYTTTITEGIRIDPNRTKRLLLLLTKGTTSSIEVSGTVTDICSGFKIDGARISSTALDNAQITNGFFSLTNQSGFTTLLASAQGYQFAVNTHFFPSVPRNQIVTIAMQPATGNFICITGTITDAHSGLPIEHVRLACDSGTISFSDRNGNYTLYTNDCTRAIQVVSEGYQDQTISIPQTPGSTVALNFSLIPLGGISGRITDSTSSSAVKGVLVSLDENHAMNALSNLDGIFYFNNLLPGTYSLSAEHTCFDIEDCQIEVVSGEQAQCDLVADRTQEGILQGSVHDAINDHPIPEAAITTDYGARIETLDDGTFQGTLPACEQTVMVSAAGYLDRYVQKVVLSPDTPFIVNVKLIPCPALRIIQSSAPAQAECYAEKLRNLRDRLALFTGSRQVIRRFYACAPMFADMLARDPDIARRLARILIPMLEYLCDDAPCSQHADGLGVCILSHDTETPDYTACRTHACRPDRPSDEMTR